MHTDNFIQNLERLANKNGLKFKVRKPAIESAIVAFEEHNGITMPQQVKWFYLVCNGLKVEAPPLEIKSIEDLNIDETGKIIFAIFDKRHRICFDVSKNNGPITKKKVLNIRAGPRANRPAAPARMASKRKMRCGRTANSLRSNSAVRLSSAASNAG
jgi:hypothetical protein